MSKNEIAAAFENFGVLSEADDWENSDFLEAHYPVMVQKIIASNCLESADNIIGELQALIAVSSAPEAQRLLDRHQGWRVRTETASESQRPGMNRGFVQS